MTQARSSCSFCGLPESPIRRMWESGREVARICCECVARTYAYQHGTYMRYPSPNLLGSPLTERDEWNQLHTDFRLDDEHVAALLPYIDWLIANGHMAEARFVLRSQLAFFPDEPELVSRLNALGPDDD